MAEVQAQIDFHQAQIAILSAASFAEEVDAIACVGYKEVNAFIKDKLGKNCNKRLEGNKDYKSGGRQTSLVCSHKDKGCMFRIVCKKSKSLGSHFKVIASESNLVHGGDGVVCGSKWKPSAKDLLSNSQFSALHQKTGGSKRKATHKSVRIIKTSIALSYPSIPPTTDVVKKANKLLRYSADEHLNSYKYILPMCEIAKEQNSNFCFDVTKDAKNVFRRMAILFPFSISAFKCGFEVIGLDAAHMGTIMLGNLSREQLELVGRVELDGGQGFMLSKLLLTLVTGKTYNNEAVVYGYMLHHTENADDLFYFLTFLKANGLDINRNKVTVLTDRGLAYASAVSKALPNALHHYCPVHIQRNLVAKVHCNPAEISQYWKIQRCKCSADYKREMLALGAMKPHGEAAVKYLEAIDGVWQLYKVIERGNTIHEIKSDNLVEGYFALLWRERMDLSAFHFFYEMLSSTYERVNSLKESIKELPTSEFLVPYAKSVFDSNTEQALSHTYTVSYNNTAVDSIVADVSCMAGVPPRIRSYHVDFRTRTCACKHWQQSGVPCIHQQAALLHYPQRKGGPLSTKASHFYSWCDAAKYRETFADAEFSVPYLPAVQERADSDPGKYTMFPSIFCDPSASSSSQRFASQGDKPSGGGVSRSAASRLQKAPCPRCGKWISSATKHPISACKSYKKRMYPVSVAEVSSTPAHDPYTVVNDIV